MPIVLYTDGTWLSKNGAHDIKPLCMTIGNFPIAVMNKDEAKKANQPNVYHSFINVYSLMGRWSATCPSWKCQTRYVAGRR